MEMVKEEEEKEKKKEVKISACLSTYQHVGEEEL